MSLITVLPLLLEFPLPGMLSFIGLCPSWLVPAGYGFLWPAWASSVGQTLISPPCSRAEVGTELQAQEKLVE
jgi:hypothetical protein